jgi:hypothetical protein
MFNGLSVHGITDIMYSLLNVFFNLNKEKKNFFLINIINIYK